MPLKALRWAGHAFQSQKELTAAAIKLMIDSVPVSQR
jgi:hypothetical protein